MFDDAPPKQLPEKVLKSQAATAVWAVVFTGVHRCAWGRNSRAHNAGVESFPMDNAREICPKTGTESTAWSRNVPTTW